MRRTSPTTILSKEISASADPGRVTAGLRLWMENPENERMFRKGKKNERKWLVPVFAASTLWPERLARNPALGEWLTESGRLETRFKKTVAAQALAGRLRENETQKQKLRELRQWKQRETLRILARDVTGRAPLEETTADLATVADLVLDQVFQIHRTEQTPQWGKFCFPFVILGMGKLGGNELNYNSDVDVLFCYGREGERRTASGGRTTHHQLFTQLAQKIINAVTEQSEDGLLYRMDLRLRPEGKSGPLVRSLESYETYYSSWGLSWERLALIKTRPVGGSLPLGEEFLEAVQPFRYPRTVSPSCLEEVAVLKQRMEQEILGPDELDRNVKLGRGGIREIEFIVQSLQLLHAGKNPFLQEANTLLALQKLARYRVLPQRPADTLAQAYRFFRTVEHRLQMDAEAQTHTLPEDFQSLSRLSRGCGWKTVKLFQAVRQHHAQLVRGLYAKYLPISRSKKYRLSKKISSALAQLTAEPAFGHVPAEVTSRLEQLAPLIVRLRPTLGDADAALSLLHEYAEAYGARATLFESLAANPQRLKNLLLFFDASPYLARVAIAHPDWLDDAMRADVLRIEKNAETQIAEMKSFWHQDPARIRLYWQAEMVRIGLRDILGLTSPLQRERDLSALTDALLRFTWPPTSNMAAVALGKLGGQELGYGADVDLLLMAEGTAKTLRTCEQDVQRWLGRLAEIRGTEPMPTVDLRLRPEGEKGPLVASLAHFRSYHGGRAEFWERQMLTRARFLCGNVRLGREFLATAKSLACGNPLTLADLRCARAMRHRIEQERSKPDSARDFKTGMGGLVDVEFLVQWRQMNCGPPQPNTRVALLSFPHAKTLQTSYGFLRQVEAVLSRRECKKTTSWPEDPKIQLWLSAQCRLSVSKLGEKMKTHRKKIHQFYERWLTAQEKASG